MQLPRSPDVVQGEAIVSLLQLIAAFPERVASKYTDHVDRIQPYIFSTRETTREAACQLIAFVLLSSPTSQRTYYINSLLAILKNKFVPTDRDDYARSHYF